MSKQDIYNYQTSYHLEFVEDETNKQTSYRRNQIRKTFLPSMRREDPDIENKLLKINRKLKKLNPVIEKELKVLAGYVYEDHFIDRLKFKQLPELLRKELIVYILRSCDVEMMNIDSGDIGRADEFISSAKPAKLFNPTKQVYFKTTKDKVELTLQSG